MAAELLLVLDTIDAPDSEVSQIDQTGLIILGESDV